MALPRRCTECGKALEGRQKYTCCATHRSARSRRIRNQNKAAADGRWTKESIVHEAFSEAAGDVAAEVMKEELRPIAREAITEDTTRALAKMVELLPRAVQCIEEDLYAEDPVARRRAYTLLTKYTIGHPAVVRPEDEVSGQMVVNFHLPRPGDDVDDYDAVGELVDDQRRTCDMCEVEKPITDFVAGSKRCSTCYDRAREHAAALLDAG